MQRIYSDCTECHGKGLISISTNENRCIAVACPTCQQQHIFDLEKVIDNMKDDLLTAQEDLDRLSAWYVEYAGDLRFVNFKQYVNDIRVQIGKAMIEDELTP